jgi:hypothetical protein
MTSVRLFNDDRAIQSLRDSDFDHLSAYAEVIDNSIQAKATAVRIRFNTTTGQNNGGSAIRSLAFADDGTGMGAATLHNCLQLGWSSRYNDRDGIGRFGVGMTMGAIHECRRVEVWSRVEGASHWLKVVLDLDEVQDGTLLIGEPVIAALPDDYADLLGNSAHGTLVVWSKYDRWSGSQKEFERMLNDFRVFCGRTFRHFIWGDPGVTIQINGELVHAIDPLYSRVEKTRFPGDPLAEVYDKVVVKWPNEDGKDEEIIIRISILPEAFRPTQGTGGSPEAKARFIDRNEGISILRNGREVFYGEPPFWSTGDGKKWRFEEIDRWWGCEISFPASLDRAFRVKNIKRGAEPVSQLRVLLKEKITPTRNAVLEKVRELWAQNAAKDATPGLTGDGAFKSGHNAAENVAKKAKTKAPNGPLDRDVNREATQNAALKALKNFDDQEKAALKSLFASQPFTIVNDEWPGREFLEVTHMGGAALMRYNLRHVFHQKTKELTESLVTAPETAPKIAEDLKTLIDLVFISYAKAETMFSNTDVMTADTFIDHLRANWGYYLNVYLAEWNGEVR